MKKIKCNDLEKAAYEIKNDVAAKNKKTDYKINFKCKNENQKKLIKTIEQNEIIFCTGSAGCGKSYVAFGTALNIIKDEPQKYKKIMIVVPTVQSDLEIGYLKGSIEDKIMPHAEAHLYTMGKILNKSNGDEQGKKILKDLLESGVIEIKCVSFMRGLTIDNAIVIIEESQNLPKSSFKTLLTRIGEDSKYIFLGDLEQIDNKKIKNSEETCGLRFAIEHLDDVNGIGAIEFSHSDIVRNPLITKMLDKWY